MIAGCARRLAGVLAAIALLALGACAPTVIPRGPITQAPSLDGKH